MRHAVVLMTYKTVWLLMQLISMNSMNLMETRYNKGWE